MTDPTKPEERLAHIIDSSIRLVMGPDAVYVAVYGSKESGLAHVATNVDFKAAEKTLLNAIEVLREQGARQSPERPD